MDSLRATIDMTPEQLLHAYAVGLFPMAETASDERLFWVDPERRGVFPLDGVQISSSLAKTVRANRFRIVADRDFAAVIDGCAEGGRADRPDTWINRRIRALFGQLFERGAAHSIEAYRDGMLVGGLYGLQVGRAFFGESMFHRETDASKVCFVHLAARLIAGGFNLLDAQFITPHLARLGAVEISRAEYRCRLAQAVDQRASFTPPRFADDAVDGRMALAIIRQAAAPDILPPPSTPRSRPGAADAAPGSQNPVARRP